MTELLYGSVVGEKLSSCDNSIKAHGAFGSAHIFGNEIFNVTEPAMCRPVTLQIIYFVLYSFGHPMSSKQSLLHVYVLSLIHI